MTKQQLIDALDDITYRQRQAREQQIFCDIEHDHMRAEDLLLEFLDDEEIRAAFGAVRKWYA